MSTAYVVRTGCTEYDLRLVGPFASKALARRSPFSRLPGATIVALLPADAPLPEGISTKDPRPYCLQCGSRDVETVEWVRWMADGSVFVDGGASPIDDTYCPDCRDNDLGVTFDPREVQSPRSKQQA